jgi:ribokinase
MNPSIVVVGSLNADFVIRVARFPLPGETLVGQEFTVFPGGKGANQAYAAARLGGAVRMIGQVGNDAQADWLKHSLAAAGVDVTGVRIDPTVSSGIATITIDAQGQNQIVIVPGSNGSFTFDRLRESEPVLVDAGLVLLQFEIPMATVEAAARRAKAAGALVLIDPAPAQPISAELLKMADYLTPNETELAMLTGTAPTSLSRTEAAALARKLLERGARRVLVKLGGQGALLVAQKDEQFWPAIPVKVVDTTAAGDAFNGAFAVALAEGASELQAGRYATAAAACSVSRAGAQPSMPTRSEVQELLRGSAGALADR